MTTIAILAALAAIGVNAGYEPAADGQLEYIVQIEPQLLDGLTQGHDIISEIPRGLNVRHFRVTIGTGKLPQLTAADVAGRNVRNRMPTPAGQPLEQPGVESAEVHTGYKPLTGRDGEYVIEITPMGLNDLHSNDLTGDVPADVPISRLRISTQPGSAPVEAVATAAPPSASQRFVPSAAAEPEQQGPLAASERAASDLVEVSPSDRSQLEGPGNEFAPREQPGLPARNAPQADPRLDWPVDPLAAGNSLPPGVPQKQLSLPSPPGQPTAAERNLAGENRPPLHDRRGPLPEQLEPDPQAAPLPAKNVTYDEQSRTEHQAKKPSVAARRTTNALETIEQKVKQFDDEVKDKPWLLLTITALALCVSFGANLYLGWVAWDARQRSRLLLEKFHAGEVSLS